MGNKKEPPATPLHNLVRRGDTILLGKRCQSTASGVAADYQALRWDARAVMQYAKQRGPAAATPHEVKRAFAGTTLVGDETHPGYATDADLADLSANPNQSPSKFAVAVIAKRLDLTLSTVETYAKRRKNRKTGQPAGCLK